MQDMNPSILARRIVVTCERSCINVSTEGAAHRALASALRAAGLDVAEEYRLSAADRIDLLIGKVGVEVKVKGTRRDIYRQLERYAAHDQIQALVLATAAAWPASVTQINGKPLFLASLTKGWL